MKIDKNEVYAVIKQYEQEILEQLDWWYGFEHHELNIFCNEDNPYLPDSLFHINLYTLGENGVNDMYEEVVNEMPPMTRLQIKSL